jgi:hypothetical protein
VTIAGGYASIQKRGRGDGCLAGARRRRRHQGKGEAAEKRRQRCNTWSTFEISGCNTCNIRLKANEIHASETLSATLDLLLKHPDETLATYVRNSKTLETYV